MSRLRHTRQDSQHPAVVLARIRLSSHQQGALKPHLLRHPAIDIFDFFFIPVTQLEKTGLRASGAFGAVELQGGQTVLQVFQVEYQILQPQHGPPSYGGELRWLKVGVPQCHQGPVLRGKLRQRLHGVHQPGTHDTQPLAHLHEVCVVTDKGTRGAQVDNATGCGALLAIGVNMRHDIVAQLLFLRFGDREVDVLDMGVQFLDLLRADSETDLGFRFSQRDPETTPGLEFVLRRKDPAHLLTGVAFHQRIDIVLITIRCLSHSASFALYTRCSRANATALRHSCTPMPSSGSASRVQRGWWV